MNVKLQNAYILHTRPYRDTSMLIDFFTEEYGIVSAVARGARRKKNCLQGILQPFIPLFISWVGKQELVTLTHIEAVKLLPQLQGKTLLIGLYLNELLIRVLHRFDAYRSLFLTYKNILKQLTMSDNHEILLRHFEMKLLTELGFGLTLDYEMNTRTKIIESNYYIFQPEFGMVATSKQNKMQLNVFLGQSLLAISKQQFENEKVLRDAKRLLRLAFIPLLAQKPINSRKLFYYSSCGNEI